MVFNATFNNISVISWWSVLLVEEIGVHPEKTTDMSQVTEKPYPEIMGNLLICISKMAVCSSQNCLQRFLKEIFCSGVRAFIFDITPVETSTANFS